MWSFRDSITTPRGTLASLISPRHGFQLSKVVFEERHEGEDEKSSRQQLLLESAQYTDAMHLKISSESLLGFTMFSTIWEAPRRSPRVVWLLETHLVFSCKKNAQNIISLVRFIWSFWLDKWRCLLLQTKLSSWLGNSEDKKRNVPIPEKLDNGGSTHRWRLIGLIWDRSDSTVSLYLCEERKKRLVHRKPSCKERGDTALCAEFQTRVKQFPSLNLLKTAKNVPFFL